MVDLAKSIEKEKKIYLKMVKDVGEVLSLTLSQAQNRQQLSGLTKFHRIDVTPSLDPLDGLYIGAHGLYTSEVIHLKRKFGQWKGGKVSKKQKALDKKQNVEKVPSLVGRSAQTKTRSSEGNEWWWQ